MLLANVKDPSMRQNDASAAIRHRRQGQRQRLARQLRPAPEFDERLPKNEPATAVSAPACSRLFFFHPSEKAVTDDLIYLPERPVL
jgi:hypothetical protein